MYFVFVCDVTQSSTACLFVFEEFDTFFERIPMLTKNIEILSLSRV